jgi:cytochrome c-type biogenesis protein CcmE
MNPIRKRRLAFAGAIVAAAALSVGLIALALQENLSYLHTPSEVTSGAAPSNSRFRLGGVVCEGSVRRKPNTLEIEFSITDRVRQVPVRYIGILPDMFREGTSVLATGRMERDTFLASQVLAKHDETYMPKEVAKAMAKGAALRSHGCGAR